MKKIMKRTAAVALAGVMAALLVVGIVAMVVPYL